MTATPELRPDFTALPDLASRALGGSVVLRQRRAVRRAGEPDPARAARSSRPRTSATRARSTTAGRPAAAASPAHDYAIVRLGVPGVVRGVVVDTAWFTRQLPAVRLGRGRRRRGLPVARRARPTRTG